MWGMRLTGTALVRCWHKTDQPGRSREVRSLGSTGSSGRRAKPTRLTLNGPRAVLILGAEIKNYPPRRGGFRPDSDVRPHGA
jgi:hypothetical protein